MRTALVLGAGGFIGGHMTRRLKSDGLWVRGVDLKAPEFEETGADDFIIGDLKDQSLVASVIDRPFDQIYQFAADMGGAGYIFSGKYDAEIVHNSAMINLNTLERARLMGVQNIFFSSSACIYPQENQLDPDNPDCAEHTAYPANPDSEYGWEKLFSERLYLSYNKQYGMNCKVARFHNIFGPLGAWTGGKEKAPAAVCRKVAEAPDGGSIEIWGDGKQTRSFLYIDECLEACQRLVASDFAGPVNIGSEEMIAINDLARMAINMSGKSLTIRNIPGPEGVRGRNSDNRLLREKLSWEPSQPLSVGIKATYDWVLAQHQNQRSLAN